VRLADFDLRRERPAPTPPGVSADGRRCRSRRVAMRDARWTTPASLVEGRDRAHLLATPYPVR
jgi:hypothetical protein